MSPSIDVVIPLGPKDEEFIGTVIQAARQNVRDLRKIFVIAYKPIDISGAEVILETVFPFSSEDISSRILNKGRAGWYLQQLLKLYAASVIPDILPNILVLDADTVLFKPTRFFRDELPLYDFNREVHRPYFQHMLRLHHSFVPWKPQTSGIVNLMIMQLPVLKKMFDLVESHHGKPFWQAFLEALDKTQGSGASEYEIYFHFVMRTAGGQIRHLQYDNFAFRSKVQSDGYHYRTFHWHHQPKRA